MKRFLYALIMLLFLFSNTLTYASAAPTSDPIELPMKDDGGKNWVLKNENEKYRVKWSFSSDSPYDHYEGMKINDYTVILRSFEDVYAVNENGQVLWKHSVNYPKLIAGADNSLFTVSSESFYLDEEADATKTNVARMDMNGKELNTYKDLPLALVKQKDFMYMKDIFYAGDWKGNFIALLDKGLTSLRPDGSIQWQLTEITFNKKSYDVFKMENLLADKKGNVLIGIDGQLICVNAENGNVLWALSHTLNRFAKLSKNDLLFDDKVYKITESGLSEETDLGTILSEKDEAVNHQGGYYDVDEKSSTLMNKNLKSDQTMWSYTLSDQERTMGYYLSGNFDQNLVSDKLGNVYVSTNGGTVHSLDPKGNPRFSLMITNRIFGFSQIIPLSENAVVITNNKHVVCLEKVDQSSDYISLWVDGQEKELQRRLIFKDGRVMISLREIFEMLGAKVTWDKETYKITAEKGDKKVVLKIGSKEAVLNGSPTIFDTAPELIEDVTYVPIRYVSEALGSEVIWDGTNQSVHITTKNE